VVGGVAAGGVGAGADAVVPESHFERLLYVSWGEGVVVGVLSRESQVVLALGDV
jgi:hypothetical protein